MSIAALITEGIGPGGSVKYALTGGLDIGAAPPPPPPPVQSVIPHDDYDDLPAWWLHHYDPKDRLDQMREEIGLIPARQVRDAARAVEKAARKIAATPSLKSESQALKLVRSYERTYRQNLRKILGEARARDAAEEWRAQIRQSLIEKEEDEVLLLVASWLL